jgi:hypothetical protein
MKRFDARTVGIDQGSIILFSDFEDGGEMWTGTGRREHRQPATFSEPFRDIPAVQVTISMWDMDQKSNQRADISAEEVTTEGFTIVFRTWGDTRVARVRADWTAIGPLPDEDDWEVY